jgi:phosphate transport system substrate-binding protein
VKRLMRPLPVLALALAACGGGDRAPGDSTAATSSGSSDLTGAGATFPYPLYSKWFSDYARETGVRINYQSIGSGGGIRQISEQTVDFGASDAPMTDQELSAAKGGRLLHFPSILGAVVVTYNVPGVTQPLKLTGEMIARIYRGEVTKWDHAELAALNPGITLPNRDILPAYRSDGSGTTFVFTDYLATVSPAWSQKPGRGKQVEFPAGLGGKGNEGVAGLVKQTPGADAYPIATFTWLLVYETQPDADKGRKLADFLRWAYDAGQRSADALGYAPLPASLTARLTQRVDSLRIGATR